ncbi:hypothetical protein MRX96_023368 [Rhipicephalus microplus]
MRLRHISPRVEKSAVRIHSLKLALGRHRVSTRGVTQLHRWSDQGTQNAKVEARHAFATTVTTPPEDGIRASLQMGYSAIASDATSFKYSLCDTVHIRERETTSSVGRKWVTN